jgi:hypothetical protein
MEKKRKVRSKSGDTIELNTGVYNHLDRSTGIGTGTDTDTSTLQKKTKQKTFHHTLINSLLLLQIKNPKSSKQSSQPHRMFNPTQHKIRALFSFPRSQLGLHLQQRRIPDQFRVSLSDRSDCIFQSVRDVVFEGLFGEVGQVGGEGDFGGEFGGFVGG